MNASLAAKNVAGAFAVTAGMKGPSRQAPWLLASRNHAVAGRLVANLRHGDASDRTQAPEYHRYKAMIQRCRNPKHPGFKNYGLRGITVCDRWRFGENGESGYQCFLTDMGRRPSPKYLIDRINNDGNFEPGNCRWSTRAERASNQRRGALVTPT